MAMHGRLDLNCEISCGQNSWRLLPSRLRFGGQRCGGSVKEGGAEGQRREEGEGQSQRERKGQRRSTEARPAAIRLEREGVRVGWLSGIHAVCSVASAGGWWIGGAQEWRRRYHPQREEVRSQCAALCRAHNDRRVHCNADALSPSAESAPHSRPIWPAG